MNILSNNTNPISTHGQKTKNKTAIKDTVGIKTIGTNLTPLKKSNAVGNLTLETLLYKMDVMNPMIIPPNIDVCKLVKPKKVEVILWTTSLFLWNHIIEITLLSSIWIKGTWILQNTKYANNEQNVAAPLSLENVMVIATQKSIFKCKFTNGSGDSAEKDVLAGKYQHEAF